MKKFWKKIHQNKWIERNWKCYNLTTPAQNVKILLQQSLLCLSKQYLFSSFSGTKKLNTSKFLSDYWEGVPASTRKDQLSVAHRWLIECFEWQFWSVLVKQKNHYKKFLSNYNHIQVIQTLHFVFELTSYSVLYQRALFLFKPYWAHSSSKFPKSSNKSPFSPYR